MQAFPITSRLQVGVIPTMERSEAIPWWHRREAWESEPNAVGKPRGSSCAALRRISRKMQPVGSG